MPYESPVTRTGVDLPFRAFLDAAPDAIVILDHQECIVMMNSYAEKIFRYRREELMGFKVEVLIPEYSRNGFKTFSAGEQREASGRRKDGAEFPVEISVSPLERLEEKLAICIVRDVHPKKQLEAKFRDLFESAPDGMAVVDPSGKIAIVNSQTVKLFGYSKEELLGRSIEVLVSDRFRDSSFGFREHSVLLSIEAGRPLTGFRKDGTEFPVEMSVSPLETAQGRLITAIIRDITDRKKTESQLKETLREKETLLSEKDGLLKEIHHRVKNNLQITSSLLRLQSEFIQDKKARFLFSESQNRIQSMALVHEKLYRSSDLSKIDFYEYSESLAHLLMKSLGVNTNRIRFKMMGKPVFLSIEKAVPCGLILNELLSNCIKHAFLECRPGEIQVTVDSISDHEKVVIVEDNGVGFPEEFCFEKSETLGLQLVRTLGKQLNAKVEFNSDQGTRVRIHLN